MADMDSERGELLSEDFRLLRDGVGFRPSDQCACGRDRSFGSVGPDLRIITMWQASIFSYRLRNDFLRDDVLGDAEFCERLQAASGKEFRSRQSIRDCLPVP